MHWHYSLRHDVTQLAQAPFCVELLSISIDERRRLIKNRDASIAKFGKRSLRMKFINVYLLRVHTQHGSDYSAGGLAIAEKNASVEILSYAAQMLEKLHLKRFTCNIPE